MKALSRTKEREKSARMLNTLGSEVLWYQFGVSRISLISGFDLIGIPIYTATRPLASTISINSGKGLNHMMARAGAVAESIEFALAERPTAQFQLETYRQACRHNQYAILGPPDWQLVRGANVNEYSIFNWTSVSHLSLPQADNFLIPNELIYISEATVGHLMRMQASTNGWATGANFEDAVVQAMLEVIERDGWTIWLWHVEARGIWPPRILLGNVEDWPWLAAMIDHLSSRQITPFFFDISTGTGYPVVWCLLYDTSEVSAGIFTGYGAAWTQQHALQRALLEAIQGRCCYMAGARDDLYRRQFLLMKTFDQKQAMDLMLGIPATSPLKIESEPEIASASLLGIMRERLSKAGLRDFYIKNAGCPLKDSAFTVVKVYAPCLENYKAQWWQPSKRCLEFAAKNYVGEH